MNCKPQFFISDMIKIMKGNLARQLFLSHPGTAFSREQLLHIVWNTDYAMETRTVDMHIRTLRQKLGAYGQHIETVRGVGYRLEAQK